MTTIEPNPHSPYADADPQFRHIFPSPIFFGPPNPGVLALTACEGMAVVPDTLIETEPGAALPDGLCPACVTVMQGGEPPARPSSECGECGNPTWHGALCALCRQEKHDAWWPTRNQQPLTDEREQQIRTLDLAPLMDDRAAAIISGHLAVLLGEIDRQRAVLEEIRHLHTDSPMGPCPVCIDADALGRDEDYTVPWPCPTAQLAGARDIDPPKFRKAREAGEICPGFPEQCPNLRTIEPNPPNHYGGVRCGCADQAAEDTAARPAAPSA